MAAQDDSLRLVLMVFAARLAARTARRSSAACRALRTAVEIEADRLATSTSALPGIGSMAYDAIGAIAFAVSVTRTTSRLNFASAASSDAAKSDADLASPVLMLKTCLARNTSGS